MGNFFQRGSLMQGASSSSDLNDLPLYHQAISGGLPGATTMFPMIEHYHAGFSSSNSSFDISNQSVSKKKNRLSIGGGMQKTHQTIKINYSESSLNSLEHTLFMVDIERIKNGEDTRTTVMIKHIPNKYS